MGIVLVILIPNQHIPILQFVFYRAAKYGKTLRGTTSVAPSSGGGDTSNDMPWRDKDEDFLQFVHRVMLNAILAIGTSERRTDSLARIRI